MPGLVNVHSHLSHEPVYRGIREEHGVPNMYMTEPLRAQPGVRRVRPGVAARLARSRALRGAQVRRHDGVRHLADLRWMGRHRRQERHSRVSRARLRGRALETLRRSLARLRLGRGARPQGPRRGARVHRWAAEAPFRDALRRRLADADRKLHGRRCCATVSRPRRSGAFPSRCMPRRACSSTSRW